jgi:hypothetical protein
MIENKSSSLEDDLEKVVIELNKFCLSVDNEFKLMIRKLTVTKLTMEALTLNSSLAGQRKLDRQIAAKSGNVDNKDE